MAQIFDSVQIATEALRLVGALPNTESAPEGEDLRTALTWLDLVMSNASGVRRIYSQIEAALPMALVAGKEAYPLKDALAAVAPKEGLQNPVSAYLLSSFGRRAGDIPIVTRATFEANRWFSLNGAPEGIYIDRESEPTLYVFPVPSAEAAGRYIISLVYQNNSPTVAPKGVTGNVVSTQSHGFRAAWQLWLIYALAAHIGRGAVAALPQGRINDIQVNADRMLADLQRFENVEHDNEPPLIQAWDIVPDYDDERIRDYSKPLGGWSNP